jgi:hypothetical protein
MYLIREVFNCKPGKAKEIVKKFKQASKFMEGDMQNLKIMTDIAAPYWTVVMEYEIEDFTLFVKEIRGGGKPQPELEKIMEGYIDLVDGGYREIFMIE